MSDRIQRKPLVRFSIAALLFIMLCLGGYLGGYRVGFQAGLTKATDSQLIVLTYPVADLIQPSNSLAASSANFDTLIDLIVTTIAPNAWMESGTGNGEIQPFPSNVSLVISQTQANHKAIAALLAHLRKAPRIALTTPVPTPVNAALENVN
jgi:hypothetical protein